MKRHFFVVYFVILQSIVPLFAQKQANFWHFGNYAGLDFSQGAPVALLDSKLSTDEGCASISDENGQLLFYTNGVSVWNKNNEMMPNGSGLLGDPSSTQSAIILNHKEKPTLYYIFTVPVINKPHGVCYSVVDISLQDGLGDILEGKKNIELQKNTTEKLTAVRHRNGKDAWVIVHGWKNNNFYAYKFDHQGVDTANVVISSVGKVHEGSNLNSQGYMKANPDGSNLAVVHEESGWLEIFDFDNLSGRVSNPMEIAHDRLEYIYGVEFSPNGNFLYLSAAGTGKVYQYNLQRESIEEIVASKTFIGSTDKGVWAGALQLAPDGKIYYTVYKESYLNAIMYPDSSGTSCLHVKKAIYLGGKDHVATLGLPTFFQSYFTPETTQTTVSTTFDAQSVKLNQTFRLTKTYFDTGKAVLRNESFKELDELVQYLKKNAGVRVRIQGHTDNIGNKASNLKLSKERASSVFNYLVSKGISSDRLSAEGLGSGQPANFENTDEGRQLNRRVEVYFFN